MAICLNTLTGEEVEVPDHYLGHPVLGAYLAPLDSEVNSETKTKKTKLFSISEKASNENNEE